MGELLEGSHHSLVSKVIGKCFCPLPVVGGVQVDREGGGRGEERGEEVEEGEEGRREEEG